jgi:hypothetical protein
MASETFEKRQKEAARRARKQKKAARLMERRNEKAKTGGKLAEEKPNSRVEMALK